ncbi:protein translocase subunit yidC [Sphingomonas laterariae]|uniref:Membrane protein insertase YidC n=1 Tax=Edaphosphingomonas laterariae TaxID=861865 RepID=A0A239ES47_9SPHN|nr:membrane protein insertase YidC [Sphingomonas laterariae]SNS46684.1 protein translocase subunit yidC [Sphingomonas laterariae]
MENWRNVVLACVLSLLVLFGWPYVANHFFPPANPPATKIVDGKSVPLPAPGATPAADAPAAIRARAVVLKESPRVAIDTPRLKGSINLKGARIDDLVMVSYRETIAKNAPPVRLLSPGGTVDGYFAAFGFSGDGVAAPSDQTVWQTSDTVLAPGKPVTLSWRNDVGQLFTIKLSVDENYLFTIEQGVANGSANAIAVRPWSLVSRTGHSKDPDSWTIHTGPIGTFNGSTNYSVNFKDLDEGEAPRFNSTGGWLGFGDKYWLTALAPDQSKAFEAGFRRGGTDRYQADFSTAPVVLQPGKAITTKSHFFAGAKEVAVLDAYKKHQGFVNFDRAIDWGWFIWFEKPIFYVLDWLFKLAGNFGVAIILLTCIVRGLMFPIAQKQFASMAAMRAVQPKMKEIQERYKDDKQKMQQELLALYQKEKVNPLAGCLPILLQIPIFYALYKVLMLTIEMRHQPFVAWIKDLSAPDPMTPLNLFGLLDFAPPAFLAIGVLPILLGITMYLQFKLNPAPMDPVQQQVFSIMPWIFMFIMAPFAAGLQLYWTVSNLLTIAQQKWLYSRHPGLIAAEGKA